jgi:hypothetical protein
MIDIKRMRFPSTKCCRLPLSLRKFVIEKPADPHSLLRKVILLELGVCEG